MSNKTYNGWTNYETWLIKLWFDNDGTTQYFAEIAEENDFIDDAYDLSKYIREYLDENQPEITGLWADLINAGISAANLEEIAESIMEDYVEAT